MACKNSEKAPNNTKSAPAKTVVSNSCPKLEINSETYASISIGGVKILESSITGNDLKVKIEYSGCEEDNIYLAWNGLLAKSYPGKATFKVGLVKSGQCDAIQTRELCTNIAALATHKKVIVYLNSMENGLSYESVE
jgi:hypothetical protein